MSTIDETKGAVNKGWLVVGVTPKVGHNKDKHLHQVTLTKDGQTYTALELAVSDESKFIPNTVVDFVIKSPGAAGKPSWIALDEVMPMAVEKDALYAARDAVKCTIELMNNGILTYTDLSSVENNARSILNIMLKLSKEVPQHG